MPKIIANPSCANTVALILNNACRNEFQQIRRSCYNNENVLNDFNLLNDIRSIAGGPGAAVPRYGYLFTGEGAILPHVFINVHRHNGVMFA